MKHKTILSLILTTILIPLFFVNTVNANSRSDWSNGQSHLTFEHKIVNEYNKIRNKRIDGYYGTKESKGYKIMKGYEITMVNHLSSKIKAKKCSDLQSRIPALDTGYYVFLSVSGKQATSKLISKRCTSVASLIPAITHIL